MGLGSNVLAVVPALVAQQSFPQETARAIERGVEYLRETQAPDGTWGGVRVGTTALALYALLKSGVPAHDVAVLDAVAHVYAMGPPAQTYDTAVAILALVAHDPKVHAERIAELARALLQWQRGGWGYPDGGDLSNTQYAALGLWAAERNGVEVPNAAWRELLAALDDYRARDGGFGYRPGSEATGSMTAAGAGTLAICRDGLEGALDEAAAARIDERIENAVRWLDKRFTVTTNPGGGAWTHYYLYGLERLGALARRTHYGEHDWYREGAEHLLDVQDVEGSWSDSDRTWSTAFALLFLRRATLPSTSSGGEYPQSATARAALLGEAEPVRLVAAGAEPTSLWIDGFGEQSLTAFAWPGEVERGLRVERVVYFDGRFPVVTVEGDPSRPSEGERFAAQHRFVDGGLHRIRAEVHLVTPSLGDDPAAAPRTRVLCSGVLELDVGEREPPWHAELVRDSARNRMPSARPSAVASSDVGPAAGAGPREPSVVHDARRAVDGRLGTCWLAAADDRAPELRIQLERAVTASSIVVTSAITRPYRPRAYRRAAEIEIVLDGAEPRRVRMPYDELAKGRLELDEPTRITSITVRIVRSVPGEEHDLVGIAEVELH